MSELSEWDALPWSRIKLTVQQLQNRIYKASTQGDTQTVRMLQARVLRDKYCKLAAVRRVTTDNRGKRTPGVDGLVYLLGDEKLSLSKRLNLSNVNPKPLRRVYIPKPGKQEQRPLGIPTIEDRAYQALVKLLLEPEWEAKFEANSFGFRPGRSCHDACRAVKYALQHKTNVWVLDADIKGCFDNLDHQWILAQLTGINPKVYRAVRGWLRAGILEGQQWQPTATGTPQGGVISPLLANIALWGLEWEVHWELMEHRAQRKGSAPMGRDFAPWRYTCNLKRKKQMQAPIVRFIRYADDFVVACADEQLIRGVRNVIETRLALRGLRLHEQKTRLVNVGAGESFDFLGFTFQRWQTQRYGKGYKTVFYTNRQEVTAFSRRLRQEIRAIGLFKYSTQDELERKAERIQAILYGWLHYHKWASEASISFSKVRRLLGSMLFLEYKRIHRRNATWRDFLNKYQREITRCGKTKQVWQFGRVTIEVYEISCDGTWNKVQDARSPYDGDTHYWGKRNILLTGRAKQRLYDRQSGLCPMCNIVLTVENRWELHHKDKDRRNNKLSNLALLHRSCHLKVHRSKSRKEEPDVRKRTRPDL